MGGVVGMFLPEAYLQICSNLLRAYREHYGDGHDDAKNQEQEQIIAENMKQEQEMWKSLTGGYKEGPDYSDMWREYENMDLQTIVTNLRSFVGRYITALQTRNVEECKSA
jgi:hypothetical protein